MGCNGSKSDGVGLSDQDKQRVKESWGWFTQNDNFANNSCLIFVKLFELAPASKTLFDFVEEVTEEALMNNEQLHRHARRVTDAIGKVVDNMDHQDVVCTTVGDLGGRHAGYRVKSDYVMPVAEGVMYALKRTLKDDKFTPAHEKAWKDVLGLVGQLFVKGLKSRGGE